ncbi:NAD(P)H-binding protein [Nonomuraea longicatena]|uniref:NAD(P)H-binding protein n=1 Tax=Nonomuraea longicatena TaxID=83682 RepID=A0ABP4BU86_9ACTN
MSDILILAATGKTGRSLVRILQDAGKPVRPASRSSEVRFDWSDPGTWDAAVRGARAVYLVAPPETGLAPEFVKRASGVERFVVLSGRGADRVDADFARSMLEAEDAVQKSGAEWTILRPNNFSQNFSEDIWSEPVLSGRLAVPYAAIREPFIDVEDIAAVAAAALTGDGHAGRIYELSGPRALSFAEAAEIIARVSGRPVRYEEVSPAAYRAERLAEGWDAPDVDGVVSMYEAMNAGHVAEATEAVRQVLGRDPISFEEYAERTWS